MITIYMYKEFLMKPVCVLHSGFSCILFINVSKSLAAGMGSARGKQR